jgi:hypothetical protein
MSHSDDSPQFELLDLDDRVNFDDASSEEEGGVGFDSTPAQLKQQLHQSRCARCIYTAVAVTTCCCPSVVRRHCAQSRPLIGCYLFTILALLIITSIAFSHVWELYGDTPRGGCLRDEKTMNNFRLILRGFNTVCVVRRVVDGPHFVRSQWCERKNHRLHRYASSSRHSGRTRDRR